MRKTLQDVARYLKEIMVTMNYTSKAISMIKAKKVAHEYENRTTLSVYYPFLHNVKTILMNIGYHFNVKSTKTYEYTDIIKTFSPILQELIVKGYGCGRKREIGHCDGGCRGLPISLDDSVLNLQDDIETWFDQELSYLQKS
jgi:hypothetical protein